MPIIDNSINKHIEETLLRSNADREGSHVSSGKLSASMLYQPLRFQVMKTIGVPRKPLDAYTLGKFKRGNDVEDWFVNQLDEMGVLLERQKMVEYRGVIGFVDAVVDSDKMLFHAGEMPHEIKSVTNMKLKKIAKTEVDWHYKIQATLYALAMGSSHYAIDIVSAEDLRPTVYIFEASGLKREVDQLISNYMKAMEDWKRDRTLPKFEAHPMCKWSADLRYSMFDEFWAVESDGACIRQMEALKII